MGGETNLNKMLASMQPELNEDDYVFCTLNGNPDIDWAEAICTFKEKEGLTVIIKQQYADKLRLAYSFIASWITLTVHSSLEAIGLTAAFSKALSDENISCNVVAAYYHDHVFVAKKDTDKAMSILFNLSKERNNK